MEKPKRKNGQKVANIYQRHIITKERMRFNKNYIYIYIYIYIY
jgi:hypothetical protein